MYEIGVQMVEIYNEQVRDLLSSDASQKKYPFLIDKMCFKYMQTKVLVLLMIYFSNLDNMIWLFHFRVLRFIHPSKLLVFIYIYVFLAFTSSFNALFHLYEKHNGHNFGMAIICFP